MSIPAGFARDLQWLAQTLEGPLDPTGDDRPVDLVAAVTALEDGATESVSSYLGLSLLLHEPSSPLWPAGVPLTMTTLPGIDGPLGADARVGSSLLLPLRPTGPPTGAGSPGPVAAGWGVDIVLYAATPGAFVDLAADLAWLVGTPLHEVQVDEHLHPERAVGHGLSAVARASVGDQALGVLLAGGLTPEQAVLTLSGQAALAGDDLVEAAQRLLRNL